MIVVVQQHDAPKHASILRKMFRLRARVFREQLGWDVTVVDGEERDKYDKESPVYILQTDEAGQEVVGSLRLLPTTGPTLLAEIFKDTAPDAAELVSPSIWECTRFCLDDTLVQGNRALLASGTLMAALGEVAIGAGIESVLGNFDAPMLRLYRRLGLEVEILGRTTRFPRPVYLGLFPVSQEILARVKARTVAVSRPDDEPLSPGDDRPKLRVGRANAKKAPALRPGHSVQW